MPKFAVVDVETTGFSRHDRVVEIAIVTLDSITWETIDEYDTLVNPERDVGPTGVHGITAAMVEAAPIFSEIIGAVATRLQNTILIAHNLAFDRRMLAQEFARKGLASDLGIGVCTYRATRRKLSHACDEFNIALSQHHRALADARAAAELARHFQCCDQVRAATAVSISDISESPNHHTLRRGLVSASTSPMHRVVSRASHPDCESLVQQYLDMLDWVLDDGVLDKRERAEMKQLANELGISEKAQKNAHRAYLKCIILAATRDGVISAAEHKLITRIASQLDVHEAVIPDITPVAKVENIRPGNRVCFTGLATEERKAQFAALAQHAGLTPVKGVTKKGCDVLVAADPATSSGKARNARKWGIPIVSAREFDKHFSER